MLIHDAFDGQPNEVNKMLPQPTNADPWALHTTPYAYSSTSWGDCDGPDPVNGLAPACRLGRSARARRPLPAKARPVERAWRVRAWRYPDRRSSISVTPCRACRTPCSSPAKAAARLISRTRGSSRRSTRPWCTLASTGASAARFSPCTRAPTRPTRAPRRSC